MPTTVYRFYARDRAPANHVGQWQCDECGSTSWHHRDCSQYLTWCHGRHAMAPEDGGYHCECPNAQPGYGTIGAQYRHYVYHDGERLPWGDIVKIGYVLCPYEGRAIRAYGVKRARDV